MSIVYTEITLKNVGDIMAEWRGYIKKPEIREVTLNAMVDTGAWTLVINEDIREKLGLEITGIDCLRRVHTPPLWGDKKGMNPETNTLPKQPYPDRSAAGLVDYGTLADGAKETFNVAGPLQVIWKDRKTICEALVLPDAKEILLGAIPIEALDLMIHPRTEEVVGAHGDLPVHRV